MNSKGTFLYPAIVDRLNQSQTPTDVYTKTESDAKYGKLGEANTFTGTNTFTNTLTFKNSTNNNGAFFENLEYFGNVTALKFVKNNSTALMILEVNNTDSTATISAPRATGGLHINNLANPVNPDNATNKGYVDSRVVFVEKTGFGFTHQAINATRGQQVTKYYTDSISYASIATGCTGVISVACSDIPVSAQHLVITYFPKRGGNNVVIEIYQYNSTRDISSDLRSANFQFVIQK